MPCILRSFISIEFSQKKQDSPELFVSVQPREPASLDGAVVELEPVPVLISSVRKSIEAPYLSVVNAYIALDI